VQEKREKRLLVGSEITLQKKKETEKNDAAASPVILTVYPESCECLCAKQTRHVWEQT
jgi:hypothetical protein